MYIIHTTYLWISHDLTVQNHCSLCKINRLDFGWNIPFSVCGTNSVFMYNVYINFIFVWL